MATIRGRRGSWLRKWLALGLALLALRMAMPMIVAPLVAGRLSRVLGARVEIGDLTVNPLDAVVTLRDLAVHAADHPQPPIEAERVRIDVQWLPLLHRTLRVRELTLESAHIDLDLPPDGLFGIHGIGRPDPAAELPVGWRFALDRVTLRDARLRARDTDPGASSFLETVVREASFAGTAQRAAVFGKATNMRVDASIGGGRVRFEGHYDLRDEGLSFDAHAVVSDVPLAQLLSRIAERGSTDLSGTLSAKLRWRRDPRRLDTISGRVVVREAGVRVAALDEPAFSATRGVAEISALDLARRQITVQSLSLKGATLALRPDIGAPVPLITAALAPALAARNRGDESAQRPPARAWSWTIKRLDAANARLRIFASGEPTDVRADATGENIGTAAYWSPLRVRLEYGDIEAAFDGALRLTGSPPLEGRLTAEGLDFAPLARGAGLPWAELVQRGRAAVDLNVGFDAAADQDSPFYARGALTLNDLWIADGEPGGLNVTADRVALTLNGFSLPKPGRKGSARRQRPRAIQFSEAVIDAPVAHLLRKEDGALLLPAPAATASQPGDTAEIVFESVRVSGGQLTLVDLMPRPSVTWKVSQVDATARAAVASAVSWDMLQLRGNDQRFGIFELTASRADAGRRFELSAPNVPLAATGPYLANAGIPFDFAAGRGAITATGAFHAGDWEADTTLVLQAPAVRNADDLQRAVGMPIDDTLERLRDENGEVTMRMTLAARRGDRATHVESIATALREALAHAERAAPEPETFRAVSVLFAPGRFELSEEARQDLRPLAALLRSRADLVVELSADTSRADRRWLAEQALRDMLEERKGLTGFLRTLGIGRDRDRIRKALAARARGEAGRLAAADQDVLEKLLAEAPPVDESRLGELRAARLHAVVDYLSAAADAASERLIERREATWGGIALAAVRAQPALPPTATAGGLPQLPVHE